jgi:DNA ligase-associated metallophosphoesterase
MQSNIHGHTFVLDANKAVYWVEKQTLILADLHLGKVSHFRKEGMAIPLQAINTNFVKLDELIAKYPTQRIIFCGDLFHSTYNTEWELFTFWRETHQHISIIMVMGNHDVLPKQKFKAADLNLHEGFFEEDAFLFAHHPTEKALQKFVFAGHIHPVFVLSGKGRQRLRVPCFVEMKHQLLLPSFGVFTGGYEVNHLPAEAVYIISGTEVLKLHSE